MVFRHALQLGLLSFPLALVLGCGGTVETSMPDQGQGAGSPGREGPPPRFSFTDVSAESGITLENVHGGPEKITIVTETVGNGAAAIDYDGDGLLDLFVANGDVFEGDVLRAEPRPALYRNLGNLRFVDVTREAGLLFRAWGHGATRVDFDADGLADLYVTVFQGPNRFYRNRGDGGFEDVSARWGGTDEGPSTGAAFFDADQDGDLDLYVGNYVHYDPQDPPNYGNPCRWRGLIVSCGPRGTTHAPDTFYENRDGLLVEATDRFGFGAVRASYTLGMITGDLDNDGDSDLYVANDSEANYHFENLGNGRFREMAAMYGTDRNENGRAQAGMGVDFADYDNDGRFDIFVTNFSHDTNTLYHNFATPDGGTMYEDVTNASNLGIKGYRFLSWGTRMIDFDYDGWLDIVLVSGHIYPQVDVTPVGTSYPQRNHVFRNMGPSDEGRVTFRMEEPARGDAFEKAASSRGLVAADLDNDGDQDLLVVEMDAPPTLIRNDTTEQGHWIGLSLRDVPKNVDAIGARVAVEDSLGTVRWSERSAGGSFISTGDPRIHVGLGPAGGTVRKITVNWPSGKTTVHEDLAVDRYWLLDSSNDSARPL